MQLSAHPEPQEFRFRPLSGSYISQLCLKQMLIMQLLVSVPYRGATFLNMIPVFYPVQCPVVSVPYRGATFLNRKK